VKGERTKRWFRLGIVGFRLSANRGLVDVNGVQRAGLGSNFISSWDHFLTKPGSNSILTGVIFLHWATPTSVSAEVIGVNNPRRIL
jgi:hypothetical protein